MAANLPWVKPIIPYLQQAYQFEAQDVEDEDGQRVVAAIVEESLDDSFFFVNPRTDVIHHEATQHSRQGEGEELLECRTPVHVSPQVLREPPYDNGKEQRGPPLDAILVFPLAKDETAAKEEATHEFTIAALDEGDDFQSFVSLPGT